MARVPIASLPWGVLQDPRGNVISNHTLALTTHAGDAVPVYADESTTSTVTPTSDTYGYINGWIDPGDYLIERAGADNLEVTVPDSITVFPTGLPALDDLSLSAVFATGGHLGRGTFVTSGNIVWKSGVTVEGQGPGKTIIKLKDTAGAVSVIKTDGFDSLVGTDGGNLWVGVHAAKLAGFTVDGNKANNASALDGIDIYGFDVRLHEIHVHDCKQDGIYTESPLAFAIEAQPGQSGFINRFTKLDVNSCGRDGVRWYGPNDSQLGEAVLWKNASANLRVAKKGVGLVITKVHCYSGSSATTAVGDYGLYTSCLVLASHCEFESATIAACYLTGTTDVYSLAGASQSQFVGCWFYVSGTPSAAALWLDGSGSTLTACEFHGCRWQTSAINIKITGTTSRMFVTGVSIANDGFSGLSGTFSGTDFVMLRGFGLGTGVASPKFQVPAELGSPDIYGAKLTVDKGSTAQVVLGDNFGTGAASVVLGSSPGTLMYARAANLLGIGNGVRLDGTDGTGYLMLPEQSASAPNATDSAVLYAKDNGAGKTQLLVRMPTGASIVLATEV